MQDQTRLWVRGQIASRIHWLDELQSVWHTREKDKQPAMSSALVQHLPKSKNIFNKDACVNTVAAKITEISFLESKQSKSTVKNNLVFPTTYSHQTFLAVVLSCSFSRSGTVSSTL